MPRQRAVTETAQELPGYGELLEALKARIKGAQVRAALAANRELIALYWDVGRAIVGRQQSDEWGTSVIERLSRDLRAAFPEAHGFSPRNLWRMRQFYLAYAEPEPPPQVTAAPLATSPQHSAGVQSVFLRQLVAESPASATEAADAAVLFEILPQPVAEITEPADGPSSAAVLFEILPQAVAELLNRGDLSIDQTVQPVILPQAVAEIEDAVPAPAGSIARSVILPQPVAEPAGAEPYPGRPADQSVFLPQAVAEFTGAAAQIPEPGGGSVFLPQPVAETAAAESSPASSAGDDAILPQAVAELPWGHNIVLLEKLATRTDRLWYAAMAARYGWSRNVLVHQIETRLHTRSGRAITNFDRTIPAADSELIRELLKDPYHFGFVPLGLAVHERDLERALLSNVQHFLMELGLGFALIGSQYHLEVGGQDYYLDLLFFHVHLHRYVVVELKIGAFQPEDAGKMNFYLAAVDELMRGPDHEPSIGLILCKEHNRVVAEYALRGSTHPIGIAQFQLMERLPDPLQASLPSVREIERRLEGETVFGA